MLITYFSVFFLLYKYMKVIFFIYELVRYLFSTYLRCFEIQIIFTKKSVSVNKYISN